MTCLVDWNNVCLICLQKGEHRCVFEKDEDTGMSFADKIMKCSEFKLKKGMDQPDNICRQCMEDLSVAYKFRQSCEQSESIIKALLSQNNRELEVSGLRIKIPATLQVKKLSSESMDPTFDDNPLSQDSMKNEEDDCKTSDECENFDTADYLDHADVLEEEDDDGVAEALQTFDEMHKLELISELEDVKDVRKIKVKPASPVMEKRGRGRPKKVFHQIPMDPDFDPEETEVTYQRALIQKTRAASDPKPQKICDICGNSYKYQHALNSHMRRHRNERPFNCEFCEKAFVSAVELRRHMRVHTGQKPYECQYCNRRFSDFGSRIKHERTHTGERPYACLTCGKNFAYAHVLTVHMRTHTGEKKYTCTECGRGFTKKAYLDNHMSQHNTSSANTFEISEATATIAASEYEDKVQVERYIVGIKKEDRCDDALIQNDFQSITHVTHP